jgi:Sap, sulfolipid-1-addressing protein
MGSLVASLTPFALGVLFSPLAIIAMIAVLLSDHPGPNGVAFLVGWAISLIAITLGFMAIAGAFTVHQPSSPPAWAGAVHLIIGVVLVSSGIWLLVRGRRRVRAMAQAQSAGDVAAASAPQLPRMLQSVQHFKPGRCLLLGLGLFALNPVDLSCAVGAGLELRLSDTSAGFKTVTIVLFVLIGLLPAAIPLGLFAVQQQNAAATLERLRAWIAGHNALITAVLFFFIGVQQLVKGIGLL